MTQSVWPYDHGQQDSYSAGKALGELWCFVICPSSPQPYWDDLFAQIKNVCEQLGKHWGVPFRCRRAIDILSTGIIHPEIWQDIRAADLIIADITGRNGNVMFELGVASAWLDKDRVIIIREDNPEEARLFDINPARQLDYTKSPSGFATLMSKLIGLIQEAIARAPFEHVAVTTTFALPATLDLTTEADCRMLWGLSGAHRRILPGMGLEFGSLYIFKYGWVSVGNFTARNVRVKGEFRFTSLLPSPPYPPWLGVMLRSQGHMANSGHLALLRANGEVAITREVDGNRHEDVDIGKIEGFDPSREGFISFEVLMDESVWSLRIGSVEHATKISDLPYVFSDGRIIVEGQFCWVCLRSLEVSTVP
jgi:hypothetical protein